MKNDKPANLRELIEAARIAEAEPGNQEFWKEFSERERIRAEQGSKVVEPRLTKPGAKRTP